MITKSSTSDFFIIKTHHFNRPAQHNRLETPFISPKTPNWRMENGGSSL